MKLRLHTGCIYHFHARHSGKEITCTIVEIRDKFAQKVYLNEYVHGGLNIPVLCHVSLYMYNIGVIRLLVLRYSPQPSTS